MRRKIANPEGINLTDGKPCYFFLAFHFLIFCYILQRHALFGWIRCVIILSAVGSAAIFCPLCFGRVIWRRLFVTYGCFLAVHWWALSLFRLENFGATIINVPGFASLHPDVPSTTSGEYGVIVALDGAVLSPYRSSAEAGLISYAVRSALADYHPYVTGDDFSIIIPCRDETKYLSKTIKYTVDNTSPERLKEIVVVDDASQIPIEDTLNAELSSYYRSKVKIYRFDSKEGLIRARIYGADHSTAANILFLDGHCRPKPGWLEPLLLHLKANYKRIAAPVIQDIHNVTWTDIGTSGSKMMFDWVFEFSWYEDLTNEVPLSSGGILAITRKWWEESGKYDYGMLEWGGENLEQSMRVWLCGGEIYAVRDSFVGHIFDRPPKPNPNNQLVIQVQKNQKRAARVWLEDHYAYFQRFHKEALNLAEGAGLEERFALKQRLRCLPFVWYVRKFRTAFDRKGLLVDEYRSIIHTASRRCLTALPSQHNTAEDAAYVVLAPCLNVEFQQWLPVAGGRMLMNLGLKKCLDTMRPTTPEIGADRSHSVYVRSCDWTSVFEGNLREQFWHFDTTDNTGRIFSPEQHYATRTGHDRIHIPQAEAYEASSLCVAVHDLNSTKKYSYVNFESCHLAPPLTENDSDRFAFAWKL